MHCIQCGQLLTPGVQFCSQCGAAVAPPAYAAPVYVPQPMPARVARHVQGLGILWCLYAAMRAMLGVVGMFFLRRAAMHWNDNFGWQYGGSGMMSHGLLHLLVPILTGATFVATALALATGIGLLLRQPWARVLGIVAASLALFKPLIGTALGIYTLWVLAPASSGVEYEAIALQR